MSEEASASGEEGGGTPMCAPAHPPTVSSISNMQGGVVSIVEFPKSQQVGLESSSAFASCEVIGGKVASVTGTLETASADDSRTHVLAAMDCSPDTGRDDSVRQEGNRKRSADEAINSGYLGKKPARDSAAAESSARAGRSLGSSQDKEQNGTRRAEGGAAREVAARVATYARNDLGPYVVYVYASVSNGSSPHPLSMARVISVVSGNHIKEIKNIGRGKSLVVLKSAVAANSLINSGELKIHKYNAFIPSYLVSRTGVIKNIPVEFSEAYLVDNIRASAKVLEVMRFNRKIYKEGKTEFVPSATIKVKFEGRVLPKSVSLFFTILSVTPYIPRTSVCYNCFRTGHISKACKSVPRCVYCGKNKHADTEPCSNMADSPHCINCGGAHLATASICPHIIFQKEVASLAATENIPVFEARNRLSPTSSAPACGSANVSTNQDFVGFPMLPLGGSTSSPASGLSLSSPCDRKVPGVTKYGRAQSMHAQGITYAQMAAKESVTRGGNVHNASNLSDRRGYKHNVNIEAESTNQSSNSQQKVNRHLGCWNQQHRDNLLCPNGRMEFQHNGEIFSRPSSQEHAYASANSLEPSVKEFASRLISFAFTEILPLVMQGNYAGIIGALCGFAALYTAPQPRTDIEGPIQNLLSPSNAV